MLSAARLRLAAPIVGFAFAACLAMAGPAAGDVVPFVDCVAPGPGTVNVYFGYTNDGPSVSIPFGEGNEIFPGIQYQGQPTVLDEGTYNRVFRATWNQSAFSAIEWILNGHTAVATRAGPSPSPTCIAGATGPAYDLTPTTATLSAVVGAAGLRTTYNFEYGVGTVPGLSTSPIVLATGQHSFVREELTGLAPGTSYSFRVVATDEDGTTQGDLDTFTTPITPVVATPPDVATPVAQTPVLAPPVSAPSPFTVSLSAASPGSIATRRRACAEGVAAGVVVTSDRAGTATVSAMVGKLTVGSRRVSLATGKNVVALCLNKAGRGLLGASGRRGRRLHALVTVEAQAGTESARGSVLVRFSRSAT